ncbi:MAG: VOC family virulence protein [Ilumatobacter sp.]|nr:VOC family virulence protein [Ilumatobacter sp.]
MSEDGHDVRVIGLDHLVLRCADVETTLRWYLDRFGLAPVRVDEWRAGGAPFPSVRVDDRTIIDLVPADGPSGGGHLDHFCIEIAETDLVALADAGEFDVVDGPGPRFGARGMGSSLYVRDPDGTIVELRHYGAAPAG